MKKNGPDAVAGISSARCTNEENYLMQKFIRAVIGTNNIDCCARVCHSPTALGMQRSFGKTIGRVALVKKDQLLFVLATSGDKQTRAIRAAVTAIKSRLPCKTQVVTEIR